VWTAKRILIYLTALLGFLALFAVFVSFFGWVDNLPKLPLHYVEESKDGGPDDPTPGLGKESDKDFKIRQAFGNDCEEYKRLSRVYLASKGAVLAIDTFNIEPDGRVKLTPFSAGLFPKNKGEQRYPEITTIQAEVAYLTLDRKINSLTELSKSKVIAVELAGDKGVTIRNNRKTQELNDDLELKIKEGKLYYEDARNLIWSDGVIELTDTQSKPEPTKITAIGLLVNLSKDTSPNRDKKVAPKKSEGVSGVEKITLLKNVDMHLYVDARSGFMTGPDELAKKQAAKDDGKDKAHIHIKTNGTFVYDLVEETARFDAPAKAALTHDRVTVTRHLLNAAKGGMSTDLLDCDRLDLQFRKKADKDAGSNEKDIKSAIATANAGDVVKLHLESEEMHAIGAEMRYFAPTPTSGPSTIIKGSPMHALRQGHEIRCEELHLTGADKNGNGQEAFAKGRGKIDLIDKQTGRSTTHIHFSKSFAVTKDRDGDRVYDLLTLRGDVVYIDDERKHELKAAQYVHVWLEDVKADAKAPAPPADAAKKDAAPPKKQRPHKLEAFEKVQMFAPQLIIRETNHLTVVFREPTTALSKADGAVSAFAAVGPAPAKATTASNTPKQAEKGPSVFLLPPVETPKVAADPSQEKEKTKKPIEIAAGKITAYVASVGNTNELLEFVAENAVHVTQAAENPKDKGLDIVGNMLHLNRKAQGDVLDVFGDGKKPAQLQFNEMYLWGPKVTIDQAANVANVDGTGCMDAQSNTTLDGKKKEGRIRIYWNKSMWFGGRVAEFHGGVQAFQENSKVQCEEMQVTLDKPVHFKQTQGSQTAKVEKIVCQGKDVVDVKTGALISRQFVEIRESEHDKNQKLVFDRRMVLALADVNNTEQRLEGSGPGTLDFIGRSTSNDNVLGGANTTSPPKNDVPKAEEAILKWTRIRFDGNVVSHTTIAGGGRKTDFYDNVRVFHQPGDNLNQHDPTEPIKDALWLTCQQLTVIQRKVGEKSSQEMIAKGGARYVTFKTLQFNGTAKEVKYNEATDTIILEGDVTINEVPAVRGAPPKTQFGQYFLYNRKTGKLSGNTGVIQR
jgi:hypothetical protein